MNRAGAVAARFIAELFPKPPHLQIERHLKREDIEEIVRGAYDIGFQDGQKAARTTPENGG